MLRELSTRDLVVVRARGPCFQGALISAYIPPNEHHEEFLRRLDYAAATLENLAILLVGDLNAWAIIWGSSRNNLRGNEVAQWTAGRGLRILNRPERGPTFVGNGGSSSVDVSLATPELADRCVSWDVAFETGSDHGLVTMRFVGRAPNEINQPTASRYNTRKANWRVFRSEADALMVDYVLSAPEDRQGLKETVEDLEQVLLSAAELTMKRKTIVSRDRVPWWSADLGDKRASMRRALRVKQRCTDPARRRELEAQYARERRGFKTAVRRAKRQSWRNFVEGELAKNPWGLPYRVLRKKIGPEATLGAITVNGVAALDWEQAGNAFLGAVFPQDSTLEDSPADRETRLAINDPPQTQVAPPWTMKQLKDAMDCFGRYKAPGLEGIDMAMVKEAPPRYHEELLAVFNRARETSEFPEQWKVASIKALLKSPERDPTKAGSYRPISLLSVQGKLLERLVLNSLEPHLTPALHPNQFGCVKGKSTEDAIAKLMGLVDRKRGKLAMTIFYDVEGAFNAVWWPLVLARLRDLGVPSDLYKLLVSYFSRRRAELFFRNGKVSRDVSRGCPQGSVLGAAIWNLAFSGLLYELEDEGYPAIAYVDDLAVVVEAGAQDDLSMRATRCSQIVQEWCAKARLSTAASKTQALVMRGTKTARETTTFMVAGESVAAGLSAKYLGVMIHRNHMLDPHLSLLQDKVCSVVGLLRGVRGASWGIEFADALRYYNTVFLPTVLYAASAWWSNPSKRVRMKMESIQRMALVPLTKGYRTAATAALQVIAGMPPLDLVLDARVAITKVKHPQRTCVKVRPDLEAHIRAHRNMNDRIKAIDAWLWAEWQARWDEGTTGRLTHQFFPNVLLRRSAAWVQPGYTMTQLLSGHGNFNAKLFYFRKRDVELCSCGGGDETAEHVVRRCPKYDDVRMRCFGGRRFSGELSEFVESAEKYAQFKIFANEWHARRGEGLNPELRNPSP
ncbi:unnamed protein product, partial [Nesidiocoris tenuis]